ncbi:MAG: tRNA pseudouridine(55) synthase TruB [Bacteroidetes bacterium]|nr:tRNA pseudouridine(55) synthase TruB [Bacteroidota bacterium]
MHAHQPELSGFAAGEVLLVAKPLGWTSFDVVNKVRFAIRHAQPDGAKIKVGHAGTLDPLATGLLILATGKATRQLETFQGLDKVYSGTLTLGQTTPSYDGETPPTPPVPTGHLDLDQVRAAAATLTGALAQIPPVYSAIKTGGKPSYRAARKGNAPELPPRSVRVDQFQILDLVDAEARFVVHCSKGTYIRSLVHDLGQLLGVGAWLSSLQRDAIGPYALRDARDLDQTLAYIAATALPPRHESQP